LPHASLAKSTHHDKSQDMTISLKDPHRIHLLNIWLYFANINKSAKITGQPNKINQLDIQMASLPHG
jgi:hypothetical protein